MVVRFLGSLLIGSGLSMMAFFGMFLLAVMAGRNAFDAEFMSWFCAFSAWGGHFYGLGMRWNQGRKWVVERAFLYSVRYAGLFAGMIASLVVLGGGVPGIANTVLPTFLTGWLPWWLALMWHAYWQPQSQPEPVKG